IGPKTAKLLYENLKIKSLKGLEENARAHNLNGLPGVKEKTEENILKGLKFLKKNRGKMRIDTAFAAAERIISRLKKLPEVVKISPAGSLRRMKEAIRDIDILAAAKKPERVISAFVKLADTADIIAQGPAKAGILTGENIRIDLRVTSPGSYGAALMYFTGSKPHNIKMRRMASKKGLKINEYGVFRVKNGKKLAGKSEAEIYELFKMPYIEPELREDTGEIEAALYGKLPKLVKLSDIKGDFHAHTEESDGILTIDEIAGIARQKNYEYIAITNHSVSLKIAGGLSEKRVLKQVEKIRNFNKRAKGITLLAGAEVDILDNGNLDYSDNLLKKLDFVIAAIHTGFHQPKEKLTFRITKAMRNKFVNLIAHPSGRLI
ncbi:MAG: PHP domain-containing protein, partial [Candidatus Omnitrophota bacterium]|nr:PHP domain-containing protein [Candidatus Omnitrophota bacterium]